MAAESEFCMLQYTMLVYGWSHHHHHQILFEHGTLNATEEIYFSMSFHSSTHHYYNDDDDDVMVIKQHSATHIPPRTCSGRVWVQLEVEPEFSRAPLMHLLCTMDLWMSKWTLSWSSAWNPLNCMAFSAH